MPRGQMLARHQVGDSVCANRKCAADLAGRPANARYCDKRCKSVEVATRHRERNPGYYSQYKGYGIDYVAYCAMVVDQANLCACCGEEMDKPCVDHDHETGLVRSLLCTQCNVGIGMFREDAERLARAIEYLNLHKRATGARPGHAAGEGGH